MNDATALEFEFYPQYCFHLSPTLKQFCHLRIADIWALTFDPGYNGVLYKSDCARCRVI
jgi:hypothetical protein